MHNFMLKLLNCVSVSRVAPTLLAVLAVALLGLISVATAEPVTHARTESNIDWASAGVCGVGGSGSGTITLGGVTGSVEKAFLYWHGIDRSGGGAVYDNQTVTINGNQVTGSPIGDATTNCWGSGSSRAFRADVTSFVSGNGSYTISGMSAGLGHSGNGASLVVTYDDGDNTNNRDLAFFEGNDSNLPAGFPGEDPGWHAVLTPIDYKAGPALAELHVADGQTIFADRPLTFATVNGSVTIPDTNLLYDGLSVPNAGTGRGNHGLWDIHGFDITAAFGGVSGLVALNVDGQENAPDCLGLVVLLLDLDPFTAPPPDIALNPQLAFNLVGTTHSLTATVTDDEGNPVPGIAVDFDVIAGPNAGVSGTGLTDAAGEAHFSYAGVGGVGVDEIVAAFDDETGTPVFSNVAFKYWDEDCNENDVPDSCDIDCGGFGGACDAFPACGQDPDGNGNGQPDSCDADVCDVDGDGDVDRKDIGAIFAARNTSASGPDDPMDANGDGVITVNDGRECVLQCTNPRCAP